TISNGANCLKPGDTLFVQAGLYAEQLSNVIPSGTSNFSPVTVMAFPGHVVTIRPGTGVSGVLTFIGPDQAYGVIDAMIVDCVNASNDCVSIQDGAHHIKIRNSEVKNSPGVGVLGGVNSEFSDLNVHDNKSHGVHFNQPNNVIYRSVIHENGGSGVEINNATTTQIYNNTVSNNSGYGIVVGADVSGTVIMNNIFSSNVNGPIHDLGTGTVVKNNLILVANLMASPTTIPGGGMLTATWSGIATPTATDWIGLFAPSDPNTAFIDWIYVSCLKTPSSPLASGSCPF